MIKVETIKEFFKKLAWIIGRNTGIALLILFFLALILGGFVFYKYGFLVEKLEPQIIEKTLQFKGTIYQKISQEWQIRQQKFEQADLKEYPNLFSLPILEETTPEETEELTE